MIPIIRYRAASTWTVDWLFALLLLALCLPLLAAVALAVWLEDRGPVLYRQTRVGLHGRPFEILKFRSMRSDAESDGCARWAQPDDPRVTRVGRFLRRTHLDELPQLVNVLRGEMRIIGPRPERPFFVQTLSAQLPAFNQRHRVKPGITGWAQVRCGYADSPVAAALKLEHDLYYIERHSLALDVRIVLATLRVVVRADGAR